MKKTKQQKIILPNKFNIFNKFQLSKILQKTSNGIKFMTIELMTLVFIMKDKRVKLYHKFLIIFPIGYIISPIDIFPDSLFIIGHIDDLVLVKISYSLLKRVIKEKIFKANRKKAESYLMKHNKKKFKIAIIISIVWIVSITLITIYIIKKLIKRKTIAMLAHYSL